MKGRPGKNCARANRRRAKRRPGEKALGDTEPGEKALGDTAPCETQPGENATCENGALRWSLWCETNKVNSVLAFWWLWGTVAEVICN